MHYFVLFYFSLKRKEIPATGGDWWLGLGNAYVFDVDYHCIKDMFTIVQTEEQPAHLYLSSSGRGEVDLVKLKNHASKKLPYGFRNPEILFSLMPATISPLPIRPINT